jgi:hypothetical protein
MNAKKTGVMWTRLTTSDQLKNINIGTLLLKYPIAGDVANSLDINDKDRISVQYVIRNLALREEFDLSLIPYQVEHFLLMISGLSNLSFAAMHKKYLEIISEGNYWIYRNE